MQSNTPSSRKPNASVFAKRALTFSIHNYAASLACKTAALQQIDFPIAQLHSSAIASEDLLCLGIFQNFQIKPFMFDKYFKSHKQK